MFSPQSAVSSSGPPQRAMSSSLVDVMMTDESAFLAGLESLIAGATGSSASCIAALRQLNLPDEFWMHLFKVVPCSKTYSHKWTLCPCAHAGETARRRDPRVVNYKAVLCPIVKGKKTCPLGDSCSYAHNVFEHWLHPSRYKTRLCSFGRNCNRPICFFAHSADELRCVPNADDGKDLDDRDYMLQLMMAQQQSEPSMLGSRFGSMSTPATPMNGVGVNAFCNPASSQPSTPFSGLLDLPLSGQPTPHSNSQSGGGLPPLSPSAVASILGNQPPIRVKPVAPNLQALGLQSSLPTPLSSNSEAAAAMQLLQLQEALASMNMEGLARGLAAASTPPAAATRISDPGFHNAEAAAKVLSSMALHRTISDSGQALPSLMPQNVAAGLESLLPFMSTVGNNHSPNNNCGNQNGNGASNTPLSPLASGLENALNSLHMNALTTSPQQNAPGTPSIIAPTPTAAAQTQDGSPPATPQGAMPRPASPGTSSTSASDAAHHMQRQMSDSLGILANGRHAPARAASAGLLQTSSGGSQAGSMTNNLLAMASGSLANAVIAEEEVMSSNGNSAAQHGLAGDAQQQLLQTMAAAGAAGVAPGAMGKILQDLQDQGLAGNKEQLVSQLLALASLLSSTGN